MRRFFVFLFVLTAVAHVPFALAFEHLARRAGIPLPWLWAALAALAGAGLLHGRVQLARWDRPISSLRRLAIEEPYYAHWGATLLATPLLALGWAGSLVAAAFGASRAEVGAIATVAYAAGLVVGVWSVFVRRRWVRVRTIDVTVAKLPRAFDGFRIVQLSDLHVGSLCPRARALRWVRIANGLGADLVALTGDYVTSGVAFHRDIADALTALRAPAGVVAVLGNHDYFGDGEPLIGLMRAGSITVLRNERTVIEREGARLVVAGVDDTWTKRADVGRTMEGTDGEPVVVLAHDPKLFPALAERGAALVLSGHTHWGQVAVPFLAKRFNLSATAMRFTADVYRLGDSVLYVSPGLGTTGPPMRLGAAPEITVLRLRAPVTA